MAKYQQHWLRTESGRLKLWSCFWEVSGHVCRCLGFFPWHSALQGGYQAEQMITGIQHFHQPCGLRAGTPLSNLPTPNIPSPLLLQKCVCTFKGEQHHHHVSSWDLKESTWKPSLRQPCPSFSQEEDCYHSDPSLYWATPLLPTLKLQGLLGNRHVQACKEAVLTAGGIIAAGFVLFQKPSSPRNAWPRNFLVS